MNLVVLIDQLRCIFYTYLLINVPNVITALDMVSVMVFVITFLLPAFK